MEPKLRTDYLIEIHKSTQAQATKAERVILFDGVCGLCNAWVDFTISHDRSRKFRFAPIQSDYGSNKLKGLGFDPTELRSIFLIENDRLYCFSTAILRILKGLGWPWKFLYAFVIIPRPLRDLAYQFVAKRRYQWFGKKETCRLPNPDELDRFIL